MPLKLSLLRGSRPKSAMASPQSVGATPYAQFARYTRRKPGLTPRVYTTRVMNPAEPSLFGGRYPGRSTWLGYSGSYGYI